MNRIRNRLYGFTLIELLVVIAIIAIIVTLAMPNFLSARQRAKDMKKKAEMSELKNALRMYYNDYQQYPDQAGSNTNLAGCGSLGNTGCPCTIAGGVNIDFAAGVNCSTVYMKRFPEGFNSSLDETLWYYPSASFDDFCLVTQLDNLGDKDLGNSQTRCASTCSPPLGTDRCPSGSNSYCMCAD
jgi:prepilin-type N-terminal cleavage/methylation domain-containing protein